MAGFKAKKRETFGKGTKALRRRGLVPAVLFGKDHPSVPLCLDCGEFVAEYSQVGEAAVADLVFSGERVPVLISDIQRDPVSDELIHVSFQRVAVGEKVTVTVPVGIVGESPIVKSGEGMLLSILSELELECFPKDIPAAIEVDISYLSAIDEGVTVGELPLDFSKVVVVGHPLDALIAKIEPAEMEEVEEVEDVSVEDVEATAEKGEGEEEGEAPSAEGEEAADESES